MTHATSGRVGSGRIGSGRVGSGRVGSGRVGSGRFTARSLKIEQGLPKNLVWKKTTWVLITVTYIFKIYDDIYDAFGGKILKKAAKLTILAGKY